MARASLSNLVSGRLLGIPKRANSLVKKRMGVPKNISVLNKDENMRNSISIMSGGDYSTHLKLPMNKPRYKRVISPMLMHDISNTGFKFDSADKTKYDTFNPNSTHTDMKSHRKLSN